MKLLHYVLFFLLSMITLSSYGQIDPEIDSMKHVLKTQNGIIKIKTLDELAWNLRDEKDSSGIKYALECLKLSKEFSNFKYETSSLNILGKAAKVHEEFEDAENYFKKALELSKKYDYAHGIARGYNELGLFYKNQEKNIEATEAFINSSELFEAQGNYRAAAKATSNLARLYMTIEAYKESLKYFQKSLELNKKEANLEGVAEVYRDLGTLSKLRENYDEMLEYSLKAKNIFEKLNEDFDAFQTGIQMAESYYYLDEDKKSKKAYLKLLELIPDYRIENPSNLYHNLAALYKKIGVLDSARYYYEKAQRIFKKEKDFVNLAKNYNNLGNLYLSNGNLDKAIMNFESSLQLQKSTQNFSLLEKTYRLMSISHKEKNNHQIAYMYKDSSTNIKNRIYESIKKADKYELAYEKEKRKLAVAEKEEEISKSKNGKKNTIIIVLFILLFVAVVLFLALMREKKLKQEKKLTQLAFKQQKIEAQLAKEQQEKALEEMLKEQERKAITTMISGQEEERERIAKDLHDRLGSMLSVVKIHYKSVESDLEKIKNETRSQYEKANELLDEACETVRKIAHNMVSGTLTKFGLTPALKELKQKIEETKTLQIELLTYGLDNRLDNTTEIQLYRIIQELLNNILKHANASEVTIQLLKRETDLNIMVSDNGIGFDVTNSEYEGMGLKSIKARVAEMNGQVLIDSSKGNGATVTIEIPT